VKRALLIVRLAWFLGGVFILMGLAEFVVRIRDFDGIWPIAFWVVTLCGGGTMILVGTFVVRDRPWQSFALVAGGGVIASVASAWTLLLPLLAVTLVVLTLKRTHEALAEPVSRTRRRDRGRRRPNTARRNSPRAAP